MKDRRRLRTVFDKNGCPVRKRISSLVTNSDQCMFRIRLRHQLIINQYFPLQQQHQLWQQQCKKKKRIAGFHPTATGRHLPYGITQCYLPPDTSERTPPSPQPVSRYSIYLPWRDGRLSWPRLPGNAPAGNQTRDLSITSPTTYHYTNRASAVLLQCAE